MKFLLVMHYAPPHIGGMENVLNKQWESLVRLGHDVTVVTCRDNKNEPPQEKINTHVRIIRLPALNFVEKKFGMAFPIISPLALLKFIRLAKENDIIHIHDAFYMTSHYAGIVARALRKPLFMTQHVAIVDHPKKSIKLIQQAIFSTIGKALFSWSSKIVVYNTNVQRFIISRGIDRSKVVLTQNGIDTKIFKPVSKTKRGILRKKYGYSKDEKIVLFVGRLIHEKGYDFVCKAASKDHKTLIVGNGKVPKNLKKLPNVTFFGPASQQQLKEIYPMCDVFVFPASVEVFALAMQEAQACGLPIITLNNPHYKHLRKSNNTGIIFIERNHESMRSALKDILQNSECYDFLSQNSRQFALNKFSWNKNYVNEYSIYKGLPL